ncbi:flavin reductase family protein [Acidocella sp.]|uniref:flavin reductase family protein n=1 Tax=Acidocella sp. TaxID=50710 RepID=UPI003D03354E
MTPTRTEASVQEICALSKNVYALRLKPAKAFCFKPGQHVLVGIQEGGPQRCYSMAGAAMPDGLIELHIRKWTGGAFSDLALSSLASGQSVDLSGPFGDFMFPDGDKQVLMLATGTGIAPFKAMLETYLPVSGERSIVLYWGGRTLADFYMLPQLELWQNRYKNFRFSLVCSGLGQGYVQDAARNKLKDLSGINVLACGNPRMIQDAKKIFATDMAGAPALFSSDPFDAAGLYETELADAGARTIELFVNGARIEVKGGQTLLAALKAANYPIMSVCRGKAACGTCAVELEPESRAIVKAPDRTEANLLSCLPDIHAGSRLACQINLTADSDGLTISMPMKQ